MKKISGNNNPKHNCLGNLFPPIAEARYGQEIKRAVFRLRVENIGIDDSKKNLLSMRKLGKIFENARTPKCMTISL